MRKPAVKSFAGWRSITACTNTSPRTQRFADGSFRANPFPPRRSGARSGNCAATGLCSCGLSLRTYTRSMWKVMSICSGRGTESFFNNLPPAPQRAGGVISISWHTNHPFLSRISGISARPRSTASLLFSLAAYRRCSLSGTPAVFSERLPAVAARGHRLAGVVLCADPRCGLPLPAGRRRVAAAIDETAAYGRSFQ